MKIVIFIILICVVLFVALNDRLLDRDNEVENWW